MSDPTWICTNSPWHEWGNVLTCRWCDATRTPAEAIMSGLASRRGGTEEAAQALLDAHRTEVLTEAIDGLTDCLRLGGMTQRGLVLARKRLVALRDGGTPELPRRNVRHPRIAERCREKPGEWLKVGGYANDQSAYGVAHSVKTARVPAYLPAGAFEARIEQTENGASVYARYVGQTPEAGEPA